MIMQSDEYYSKRQYFRLFKAHVKNEVVKLAMLVLVCVVIATLMGKGKEQTSYTFYYAQSKVVNKHTRGIFPPLEGRSHEINGLWSIEAKIGQSFMQIEEFKNYLIEFDKGGRIFITKKETNCLPNQNFLVFKWNVYSYNMFISEYPKELQAKLQEAFANNITLFEENKDAYLTSHLQNEGQNKELDQSVPNYRNLQQGESQSPASPGQAEQSEDEDNFIVGSQTYTNETVFDREAECFGDSQEIISHLRSFTIWTMRQGRLYLISQPIYNGTLDLSIFVLSKL